LLNATAIFLNATAGAAGRQVKRWEASLILRE
jgi:hypothetical protein